MKSTSPFAAIAAVAALLASSASVADAQVVCTTDWRPVCGSDGVIYSNACNAEAAGAEVAYETAGDVTAGDGCVVLVVLTPCSLEYQPVCGSDGVVYGNACTAEANEGVTVAYDIVGEPTSDECDPDTPPTPPTPCTLEFVPVCGSDGVIYSNACNAEAAGAEVAYETAGDATAGDACDPDTPSTPEGCLVGDIMYQEGDSIGHIGLECVDDVTYDARASTCGPDGEIIETEEQYSCSGSTPYCMQCGPRGIGAALCLSSPDLGDRDCGTTTTSPPVVCTTDWRPVCGDDGVIYSNACNAEAAGAEVAYEAAADVGPGDECDPEDPPTPPTPCTLEFVPVCGSDGVIYSNACNAEAAGAEVAYATAGDATAGDACDPEDPPTTSTLPTVCTTDWRPVCGDDGIIYSNACNAEAAGAEVAYEAAGDVGPGDECDPNDPPTPEGCLVGDIMYQEGDSIGHIGLECVDDVTYDARASTCGPDGEIVETEEQFSCSGSTPYCMQCGPRGIGAALCLSSPDLGDRDCGEDEAPPVPCTLDFKPVCGSDGVVYSNKCTAEANEGVTAAYYIVGEPTGDECDPDTPPPCTKEFAPVCGDDGVIYSNACNAGASAAEVAYDMIGDVTPGDECDPDTPPVPCTKILAPVCGSDGVVHSNACEAEASGAEVAYDIVGFVGSECDPEAELVPGIQSLTTPPTPAPASSATSSIVSLAGIAAAGVVATILA